MIARPISTGALRPGGMAGRAFVRVVAVVAVCSLLVLLAWPGVALADCPVGEEMCMDVEPLKGPPGSLVHVQLYAPCDPADPGAVVRFAAGDALPETIELLPSARLLLGPGLVPEAGPAGTFSVPKLRAGTYTLLYDCPTIFIAGYGTGRTFTVTPLPDTATSDPGGGPPVIAAGIGLLAVVAGIAALRRRLPVRSP